MNRGANPSAIDMFSSRKLWNWSIPSVLAVRPLWQSIYRSELYSSIESVTVVFIIRLFAIYSQSRVMLLFGSSLLAAELGIKIVSFATCKAKIEYLTLPLKVGDHGWNEARSSWWWAKTILLIRVYWLVFHRFRGLHTRRKNILVSLGFHTVGYWGMTFCIHPCSRFVFSWIAELFFGQFE